MDALSGLLFRDSAALYTGAINHNCVPGKNHHRAPQIFIFPTFQYHQPFILKHFPVQPVLQVCLDYLEKPRK